MLWASIDTGCDLDVFTTWGDRDDDGDEAKVEESNVVVEVFHKTPKIRNQLYGL